MAEQLITESRWSIMCRRIRYMVRIARGQGLMFRCVYGTNEDGTAVALAHYKGNSLIAAESTFQSVLPRITGEVNFTYESTRVMKPGHVVDPNGNQWETKHW